jgi:hypothetical protein
MMPAVSKAQYRLFQMAKHDPEKAKALDIPPKVADDFTKTYDKSMPQHVNPPNKAAKARAAALRAKTP